MSNRLKSILFLSTHNLASNPRLVKEIGLALQNKFSVEVICFEFRNWSYEVNLGIIKDFEKAGAKIFIIPAGRESFFPWLFSTGLEMFCRVLTKLGFTYIPILAQAISRRHILLVQNLHKVKKPGLVIGHNPGTLGALIKAKQLFGCKAGFDVEDYHPGEANDPSIQKLTKLLMVKALPCMGYVSLASQPIMEQVKKDIELTYPNWFTILNYFPSKEFLLPENAAAGPVKMVWFSQNISASRGLEMVLPFVSSHPLVKLHLYGYVHADFYEKNLAGIKNIFVHEPLPQLELHQALANYDIGLALDIPVDKNRDFVITNKLLAYLQAGLYVVATNTSAQSMMLQNFPENGICFNYRENKIEETLQSIIENIEKIRLAKESRFRHFEDYNWESESVQLLKAWEKQN